MGVADHPTTQIVRAKPRRKASEQPIDAAWLKNLARDCGADDAGLVEIDRPVLDDQRHFIREVFAQTKTLLSFVVQMNREPVRSPVRSVANHEFHAVYDSVNDTAREIVRALSEAGINACNSVAAFPMEVQLPARAWMVAHKPIAVAAGLGHMGLHRSVIHPKFGSFVLLGTVLVGEEASAYDRPIDFNPCLSCNLCVSACPVNALKPDGAFDFVTCYTHNYREFLGNFGDWVEDIADAKNARDYRRKVLDGETRSMWQSLSFKPGYKAAYCISACPAGEEVIPPFLDNRKAFVERIVRPLRDKAETLYVLAGSDAETDAAKQFPAKTIKRVRKTLRASSIQSFLVLSRLGFQRGKAKGHSGVIHWTFTGKEEVKVTTRIENSRFSVEPGHAGIANLSVIADSETWLKITNQDYSFRAALLLRKLRVKGPMKLFHAFRRCFPG